MKMKIAKAVDRNAAAKQTYTIEVEEKQKKTNSRGDEKLFCYISLTKIFILKDERMFLPSPPSPVSFVHQSFLFECITE